MKLVVWISGIEAPKFIEAHNWLRIDDNGVMFQDKAGENIGIVQGTFAIFEGVEPGRIQKIEEER